MICGNFKTGSWTACPACHFVPKTILDLVASVEYSDKGAYKEDLKRLSIGIRENWNAIEHGGSGNTFKIDELILSAMARRISNPSWRDMLTIKKEAKDGFFKKRLNYHEIGPDGYRHSILERGANLDAKTFDAIRSIEDGDMYVVVFYEDGQRNQHVVRKDKWYVFYDKMLLAERELYGRSKAQEFYDKLCDMLLDTYLQEGNIPF
jgi:hypothetical protein